MGLKRIRLGGLRDLSIQKKLILILMLTSSVALLVACAAFGAYELAMYRRATAADLSTMAQMIAANSPAALAFNDPRAGEETLAALSAAPSIVAACLYKKDGASFASYTRADAKGERLPVAPLEDGYSFQNDQLTLFRRIRLEDRVIGTVYLKADVRIYDRLRRYAGIIGGVMAISSLAAFLLASRLQGLISAPILHLAETANRVSQQKNYAIREVNDRQDEVGLLIDRFNEMLAQIGERDAALRLAHDGLERRVEERTRDLQAEIAERERTQQELLVAKQAAEAANRAKSAFLANMSHEIRTPLNAVLGYSQLMLRDPGLGADAQANLQIINRSGEHLLALISDILDMSKIEAGRMGLNAATFDLSGLLEDLSAMFRLRAESKGLQFDVLVDSGCARYIVADEVKLRQVLINLLGNAAKFTDRGSIQLRVAVEQRGDNQLWLTTEVEDTGVGIAAEDQSGLFRPFAQAQNGLNLQTGTGLGLAISREFIQLMGGEIGMSSELGKGTVFRFSIPVHSSHAGEAAERPVVRRVIGLAPGQTTPRVLIVDDDANNRGWLNKLLTSVGFSVREAGNGEIAIQAWQKWKPPLILMDVRMPVMDGLEATRRIRANPAGQDTVIIGLTASALEDDRRSVLDTGMDDYLLKPYREDKLLETIQARLHLVYLYAGSAPLREPEPMDAPGPPVNPELSAELIGRLQSAVVNGEKALLDRLIETVKERDARSAGFLQELADKYDYDALAHVLEEARR
jgi:signal transduction histidine kinase/ActR/RegA family two-component response regulator